MGGTHQMAVSFYSFPDPIGYQYAWNLQLNSTGSRISQAALDSWDAVTRDIAKTKKVGEDYTILGCTIRYIIPGAVVANAEGEADKGAADTCCNQTIVTGSKDLGGLVEWFNGMHSRGPQTRYYLLELLPSKQKWAHQESQYWLQRRMHSIICVRYVRSGKNSIWSRRQRRAYLPKGRQDGR